MGHKLEGNKLIIELKIDSKELSRSGKTIMLATSNGFQWEGDIGISYNIVKKKEWRFKLKSLGFRLFLKTKITSFTNKHMI